MSDNVTDEIPSSKPIPVSLFCRRTNKTTQLINNTESDFSVEGKHRWFDFKFEQPVFIQSVTVETEGYDDWNKVQFEFDHISQKKIAIKVTNNAGSYFTDVGRVISGFKFKPDEKYTWIRSQKISKVTVYGYTLDELSSFEDAISSLDTRTKSVDSKIASLAELERANQEKITILKEEAAQLQIDKSQLNSGVGQSQAQLDGLQKRVSTASTEVSELDSKVEDLTSSVLSRRNERRRLATEIDEQQSSLNRIKQDIRLFPSEIAGFVDEGSRNIKHYLWLSVPFVSVILYVTYSLFTSAIDLTHLTQNEDINVWNIFLTRLPFVTVAVTVLQVCGFVVGRFVYEIVQINKQRLNLSKISIIAKDISTASAVDLDLTTDEHFELETQLKMELLREHMKQYVGEGYTYKAGGITKIIPEWMQKQKTEKDDLEIDP